MKNLSLLILTLFLTSCDRRHYQDHHIKTTSLSPSETQKAVVVVKVRGKTGWTGAAPQVTFDFVKLDDTPKNSLKQLTCYRVTPGFFGQYNLWNQDYTYLLMEPGFYIIDNICWTIGNVTYKTYESFITTLTTYSDVGLYSGSVEYGAFKIEPGTVNYLGDLEVICSQKNTLFINKINRFNEAKQSLQKKHPHLAPHLEDTDFLPGGYNYNLRNPSTEPRHSSFQN
jgi:hypothetical protein